MIVRPAAGSHLLITQPDHAALSARIIRRWIADGFPTSPRRDVILLAVEQHDNGWQEIDDAPLVDPATGRLLDFMNAPDATRQGIWPRGVERLSHTPYAAALVAQHALHVYDHYRPRRDWTPFFAEMETLRNRHLLAAAPLTMDDLRGDYAFVRLGDLISLAFCTGWTETASDHAGYTVMYDGTRVRIAPDPFHGAVVPLEIPARQIPEPRYSSHREALDAFKRAPVVTLTAYATSR